MSRGVEALGVVARAAAQRRAWRGPRGLISRALSGVASCVPPVGLLSTVVALGFAALLSSRPADAAPSRQPLKVVEERVLIASPDAGSLEELVTLSRDVAVTLLRVPVEGRLRVADWPVSPGKRRIVTLVRHDVYAPGARIVKITSKGEVEVPRSRWAFFWGRDDEGATSVVVSVDPESGSLRGMTISEAGVMELTPPAAASSRQYRVAIPAAEAAGAASAASFTCGQETLPPVPPETARTPASAFVRPEATALAFTKSAVVAIETDNEYMLNRFGDDTTAAVNYIASLFANTNITYERDVSLHLLQGYTILRVSSVPDPYTGGSGSADGAKLNEFGNYWSAHYGAVKRTLAAMLSGKQVGGGASGIAWIGGLCSSGVGYSFNQLFLSNYLAGDTLIFGHEVGHNFGSPHTHCYSPPADNCHSGECYVGPEACPLPQTMQGVPNVAGTLMSYCHLIGCSSLVFHPRTMTEYFNAHIAGASSCIFNGGGSLPPGPTVSTINPPSGVVGGGTPVTITGSNFSATPTVAFVDLTGSVSLTVGTASAGTITATTTPHAVGAMDVVVMNADYQTGMLRNGFTYTLVVAPPTVTSINPPSGPTSGATPVTIGGANFQSGATVSIGGVAAAGVVVSSSTSISATTAAHAPGAVNVVVTNPDSQTGTLASGYTYSCVGTPTASVSGGATICAGSSAQVRADLTGPGPWNLVWSDAFTQNGVTMSPATRAVSPSSTTLYTVTSLTGAFCAGTSSGSATVTVVSCASGLPSGNLVPDGRSVHANVSASGNSYRLPARAFASYAGEIDVPFNGSGTVAGGGPSPLLSITRADGATALATAPLDRATCGASTTARLSFAPSTADLAGGPLQIHVSDGTSFGYPSRLRVSETTLYSSRWSTNGYAAFIDVQNTSGCPVSGQVLLLDSSGANVTTLPFSLGVGAATQLAIPTGLPAPTGSARLIHDGPTGAVTAGIYMTSGGPAGAAFRWPFEATRSYGATDGH